MPRKLLIAAWNEMFPDRKPRVIAPTAPVEDPFVEVRRIENRIGGFCCSETDENVLEVIVRPLAEQFLVSPTMRIRLEKLGLLLRQVPGQRILDTDA
jgi:hypothetical protein